MHHHPHSADSADPSGSQLPSVTDRPRARVRCLRTLDELADVRGFWEAHQQHPNVDFDFYRAFLECYKDSITPYVLVLDNDDLAPAILVGRIRHGPVPIKIGYRTLLQPRARVLELSYRGLLGDASSTTCRTLLANLVQAFARGDADLVRFEHLDVQSALYASARDAAGWLQRDRAVRPQSHWTAELGTNYDAFFGSLSGNSRHNLRRYTRRFEKQFDGRFEIRTYTEPRDLDRVIRDMESVAAKTYHRGLGAGFIGNIETRKLIGLAMEKGWYRSAILYIEDKPVAFWDGRKYRRTFYTDTTGYRPELYHARPGLFLLLSLLRDLCADDQVDVLDFGLGDAQYKRSLCNREWHEARIHVYSRRWRGVSINVGLTATAAAASFARRTLDEFELASRVKRSWRGRLIGSR